MSKKTTGWTQASGCRSGIMLLLACISFQAVAADQDQVQKMQQVIDRQQKQLDVQQDDLKTQKNKLDVQQDDLKTQKNQLDQQSQLLELMQKQLNALMAEPKSVAPGISTDQAAPTPAVAQSDESGTGVDTQFGTTPQKPTNGHAFGRHEKSHPSFHMNYDFFETDKFPTDISANKGVFIASDDGNKLFRIYGSLRTRAMWENRDNLEVSNLDMGDLRTGNDDIRKAKFAFSALESRIGMDMSVRDILSARAEFDLRGLDTPLRVRHLYVRNKHWLLGKNWNAFNSVPFLPLSLGYHSNGVAAGARPFQIKYTNGANNWIYQIALEDHSPSIGAPDNVEASSQNTLPNLVGHIERKGSWGQWRVAGLLAQNRVQYSGGTETEFGWGLLAGIKVHLNDSNLLKAHVLSISGLNSMLTDFGIGEYDMVYDPNKNNFHNIQSVGGQFGLEHNWSPTLITTVAAGYVDLKLKSYQDPLFFDSGYKALINLIWRPAAYLDGLWLGVEYQRAGRKNLDNSKNSTDRVNFVLWYDF